MTGEPFTSEGLGPGEFNGCPVDFRGGRHRGPGSGARAGREETPRLTIATALWSDLGMLLGVPIPTGVLPGQRGRRIGNLTEAE